MKKILAVMTALLLAVTFSGCSLFGAARLSKKEYKEQVTELIDKYLCAALIDTQEELEDYNMSEFDSDTFEEIKDIMEEGFKKADKYLDQLEKLNPPEEMQDFHDDLLSCIEKVRDAEEKNIAVCDAKSEEKFEIAKEKVNSAMEKVMKKVQDLIEDEDNDWLVEELEDGEFMEALSSFGGGSIQQSKVTSANATASSLQTNVVVFMADLESNRGTIPLDAVITIEGHAKNGEWIGSVSAPGFKTYKGGNEEAVEKLKKMLAEDFNFTSDIAVVIWVSRRRAVGCAYSDSGVSASELRGMFTADTFSSPYYSWSGKASGVIKGNKIVGTAPVLVGK